MSNSKLPPRGSEYGVRHLVCDREVAVKDFIATLVGGSEDRARELIWLGGIYVNDTRAQAENSLLRTGDRVRAHLEPRRFSGPKDLLSRVTVESPDYLIVDKPAGLPVHGLVDNARENLISFLEEARGEKLFITHRLDVDTCGLVLLARTPAAQAKLNEGFKSQTIKRSYVALVEHEVALGHHVHFMEPSPKAPKRVSPSPLAGWQRCELIVVNFEALEIASDSVSLNGVERWRFTGSTPRRIFALTVELVTGRTHQIRAQMTALGAPLVGDKRYGSPFSLTEATTGNSAIGLRAWRIRFKHDERVHE